MEEKPTIEEIMNTPNWTRREKYRFWVSLGRPPLMSKRAALIIKYYPGELIKREKQVTYG